MVSNQSNLFYVCESEPPQRNLMQMGIVEHIQQRGPTDEEKMLVFLQFMTGQSYGHIS
jgi:hypothetical protein